jgi:hypothetical protein
MTARAPRKVDFATPGLRDEPGAGPEWTYNLAKYIEQITAK